MTSTVASEEGRRFFQQRLTLMFRIGTLMSAAFAASVIGMRALLGASALAEVLTPSRLFHFAATVVVALAWLAVRRGRWGPRVLEFIDVAVTFALCVLLDLNAGFFPLRAVAVFNLVLVTGVTLILRAVVIPSTALRTGLVAVASMAAATAVFAASFSWSAWPESSSAAAGDWPLAYQAVSFGVWTGLLAVVSVVASHVIYGLRQEVRVARRIGQYVLEEKIGEGGMGIVFRAKHAMLRRETALKLLPPDRVDAMTLQRFEREVVQTARLRHPNTVAIYDYGRTRDGVFYYAMEYLEGLTLEQLVARTGPLPPGRVVHILAQVCASLEEAHAAGLVHRDVKPANIMVMGRPSAWDLVKVLDFGLVKVMSGIGGSLTSPDVLAGTPQYISPEAIARPTEVGPSSDLYGVAGVGYFLLTGTPVFDDSTVIGVCVAHLDHAPSPPSERLGRPVPPELERLLLSGLAKSSAERPGSARELRRSLLACDVPAWTEEDARVWWETVHATMEEEPRPPSPREEATTLVEPEGWRPQAQPTSPVGQA